MSKNYDNWERLVAAVLRRQHDRELALCDSRDNSSISSASFNSNLSFSSTSQSDHANNHNLPLDYSDLTVDHSGWRAMLPPGEHEVVWRSASMSFFLDQMTGKNCFLLGATHIVAELNWRTLAHPKSRFEAVAKLREAWKLEELDIRCRIKTKMLSPKTLYAAYLVFSDDESRKLESVDSFEGLSDSLQDYDYTEDDESWKLKSGNSFDGLSDLSSDDDYSKEPARTPQPSKSKNSRGDGWKEQKMGEFYADKDDNRQVEVRLIKMSRFRRMNLILEGIEFRPLVKTAKIFGTWARNRTANISYV